MLTTLFTPDFAPFTTAVAILAGLLILELAFLLLGGSLLSDTDAPEVDLDAPEMDLPEIEALEFGDVDVEALEIGDIVEAPQATPGWTGFGTVPFLIWFAALLMGFGVVGIGVQMLGPFPLWLAVPVAGAAGIGFARGFAGLFARAIPKVETSAQNPRQLARRRGVVTQGTSRRGRPAELRVADRYGNTHYVRVEPFRDGDEIARGQEVLTIWDHRAGQLRIISLD